jgi:hypothetical protein
LSLLDSLGKVSEALLIFKANANARFDAMSADVNQTQPGGNAGQRELNEVRSQVASIGQVVEGLKSDVALGAEPARKLPKILAGAGVVGAAILLFALNVVASR